MEIGRVTASIVNAKKSNLKTIRVIVLLRAMTKNQ